MLPARLLLPGRGQRSRPSAAASRACLRCLLLPPLLLLVPLPLLCLLLLLTATALLVAAFLLLLLLAVAMAAVACAPMRIGHGTTTVAHPLDVRPVLLS